jgi:short-subunit dehydrogenase
MRRVLIIGATSAIAEETARCFALQGDRLFLAARDATQMQTIAADLRLRGASEVDTAAFEATNYGTHPDLIATAKEALGELDVALIMHGTLPDQNACQQSFEQTQAEFAVNTLSVISLLTTLANHFEETRHGVLGVITSVAGDRGRQSNYVYGSAKGCLNIFLAGLRHRLARSGVTVLTIKPGFVDTPMTKDFPKGMLWASPATVARDIYRAVEKRRSVIYTPWFWRWIMGIIRLTPSSLFHKTKL